MFRIYGTFNNATGTAIWANCIYFFICRHVPTLLYVKNKDAAIVQGVPEDTLSGYNMQCRHVLL